MLILAQEEFHRVPFLFALFFMCFGFLGILLSAKTNKNPQRNFNPLMLGCGLNLIALAGSKLNWVILVGWFLLALGISMRPVMIIWTVAGIILLILGVDCGYWSW